MTSPLDQYRIEVFPSELGWMALLGAQNKLLQLTFGQPSAAAALARLDASLAANAFVDNWAGALVERLRAYARGACHDFSDVQLAPVATLFARRVIRCCRAIPYGQTRTYGQLAALAGSPRAARAVGNVMRTNRTPLIVPCHRVVGGGGQLRGYSAGEGVRMKLRLLEMELSNPAPARAPRATCPVCRTVSWQ